MVLIQEKIEPAPQFIVVHNPGITLVTASAVSDGQLCDGLRNIFFNLLILLYAIFDKALIQKNKLH